MKCIVILGHRWFQRHLKWSAWQIWFINGHLLWIMGPLRITEKHVITLKYITQAVKVLKLSYCKEHLLNITLLSCFQRSETKEVKGDWISLSWCLRVKFKVLCFRDCQLDANLSQSTFLIVPLQLSVPKLLTLLPASILFTYLLNQQASHPPSTILIFTLYLTGRYSPVLLSSQLPAGIILHR